MSGPVIQTLIGTALVDSSFRAALLNGSRRRILQLFALSNEQIEIIMDIRADSLEELAGEIHRRLIDPQDLEPSPLLRVRKGTGTADHAPFASRRSRTTSVVPEFDSLAVPARRMVSLALSDSSMTRDRLDSS